MSDASLQVHDTLTRAKHAFTPLVPGQVGIYLCGPTVYDDCHIGHLMGPVLFDAVVRWMAVRGHRVTVVNNITDIDDKIIKRHLDSGEPWQAITARYTRQYLGYLKRLHALQPGGPIRVEHPKCSDFIPQMIRYIADLIATDRAYVVDGDGVYYDVQKQDGYGKLSGRRIDDMQAGVRIERDSRLRHPADFALWKLAKPGEPTWDSPWGAGRPGWHIECSVMSTEILGETFDIHAGGDDLKFPHHENEIAQGEAHGGKYACCWMHNGLIQFEGVKVGKSDARMKDPAFRKQFDAKFLIDTYGAATVRFLLLQGHYRRPIDFAPKNLEAARTALGKLHRLLGAELDAPVAPLTAAALNDNAAHVAAFAAAMDDDFNTGAAIAALFSMAADARHLTGDDHAVAVRRIRDLGRLIGLFMPGDGADTQAAHAAAGAGDETLAKVMALVLELRQDVRARRDFAASDRIRDALAAVGIVIKDGKDGASWEFKR
jgi:cysteinyl-tRNA synthetase